MIVNGPMSGPCAVCQKEGRACSRCRTVHYCSLNHQRLHWSEHSAGCAPYRLCHNPEMGRYLEAVRDIPPGTIIMRELPVVVLPVPDPHPTSKPSWTWVCLGCCRGLQGNPQSWQRCNKCGWPMCSAQCENEAMHMEECRAMQRANFRFSDEHVSALEGEWLLVLGTLRCVLACREGGSLLLHLQSSHALCTLPQHPLAALSRQDYERELWGRVQAVRFFLCIDWIPEAELYAAAQCAAINSFFIGGDDMEFAASGILPGVAMVQHSCVPNLRLATLDAGRFESVLVTVQGVDAGKPLTLSYRSDPWSSTLERRLLTSYGFYICRCERCEDDTEFGLYVSSWCCLSCKRAKRQSMVVLRSALDSPGLQWQCETCGRFASNNEILFQMVELEQELDQLLTRCSSYVDVETFINKHVFPWGYCHESHRVILKAKRAILDLLGPERLSMLPDSLENSLDMISRRESLCQELLGIVKILKPGWSVHRRQMLAYLSESVLVRVNLSIMAQKIPFLFGEVRIIENQSVVEDLRRCMVTPKEKEQFSILLEEVEAGLSRLRHCQVPWPPDTPPIQ